MAQKTENLSEAVPDGSLLDGDEESSAGVLKARNQEAMSHYWKTMEDISTLSKDDIETLIRHLIVEVKSRRGNEMVVGIVTAINNFLYPSPHMLAWAETRLKKKPSMTPSQLAYQYAGIVMKNKRMAPSLIGDMQRLKARLAMRKKREEWRMWSGSEVKERMKGQRARVPASAAYWEKVNTPKKTKQ